MTIGRGRTQVGRWLPLRAYLGALVLLFALTATVTVFVFQYLEERNAIRDAQEEAQFGAKLAASDISSTLDSMRTTVTRTAAAPGLGPLFDNPACGLTFSLTGVVARLDLVKLDGSVACSTSPAPGTSYAGVSWMKDPTVATALAAPVEDPRTKHVSAVTAAPVPGRGMLVGILDLTTVGPALAARYSNSELQYLVTAADGTVIARSMDGIEPTSTSHIFAGAAVPGTSWTVYAGSDRAAALAPAQEIFRQHVLLTLGSMLLLLVGTLLLGRMIARPLQRLSDAMGHGTSGLVRGPVEPSGPAEIARLAARFNALVATVRAEISETARAEESAHASEANYRLLFAGNPQPLFVYDLDTLAFLEVNDAAISRYGWTRDEFRSRTVADIVTADALPGLASVKSLPDFHRSGPWRQRTKDGSFIDINMTSMRLAYDGHDARLVAVDDLTERTKLERQLQQTQRLETVGQLAGGIAHDFNNLLAVILNYADFVADELPDGPLRQDVEEIQRAASRAADLTRQLLIFARREVVDPQLLDLNAVVEGVENMLRRTIGEDIELVLSLAEGLPSVRADPGQMEQVFLNLTVNARDAMPAGGKLVVETAVVDLDDVFAAGRGDVAPGRYVRLSVSDTGVGMSREVAARAFEPFFTTKAAGKGTGLGLATVYGIIAQAGGNASIYSEPGLGTRVSIHLPAVDAPAITGVATQPGASAMGQGAIVLVVEDESAVLLAAARILNAAGYKVLMRSDPQDALQVISDVDKRVDLLLTDAVMPGLSGIELAKAATELRPELPILFMTGYSREVVTDRGTLPAGSDMVQKPFTRAELLEAIGRAISRGDPD